MTIHWLERVCVSGAGGEGGDSLGSEKSELGLRSPGLQPSSTPSMLSPGMSACPLWTSTSLSVKWGGGWVVDRPIAARGSKCCPGPGSSLSPDCLLGLTSPDWPPQISDTILLSLPSVLSFPQWPGPDSGSPPWRGQGGAGQAVVLVRPGRGASKPTTDLLSLFLEPASSPPSLLKSEPRDPASTLPAKHSIQLSKHSAQLAEGGARA